MIEKNGFRDVVRSESDNHISRLIKEFHRYFPGFEHNTPVWTFTGNPFNYSAEDLSEDEQAKQEKLLDFIYDSSVKAFLMKMMQNTYSKVAAKPLALLTAFPSTYFCESAFSSIVTKSSEQAVGCKIRSWMCSFKNQT